MATIQIESGELDRLIEKHTDGKVQLKALGLQTIDIRVKPARLIPAKSARVRVEVVLDLR